MPRDRAAGAMMRPFAKASNAFHGKFPIPSLKHFPAPCPLKQAARRIAITPRLTKAHSGRIADSGKVSGNPRFGWESCVTSPVPYLRSKLRFSSGTKVSSSKCMPRCQEMDEVPAPPISSLIRVESASHNSVLGAVDHSKTDDVASTRWLSLSTVSYRYDHDPAETYPRRWDMASRSTRQVDAEADAVVILGILRLVDGPRILLVRQFRPPLGAVSVELPAGLLDAGESVEGAALRELKEETGFVGTVRRVHEPTSLSPGLTDETVVLVEVEIEGESRGQQLDSGENIEVVSVPIGRLQEALTYMSQEEGMVIKHAVSTLAVGLQLGNILRET